MPKKQADIFEKPAVGQLTEQEKASIAEVESWDNVHKLPEAIVMGASSSGRTADSKPANEGSIPSVPAILDNMVEVETTYREGKVVEVKVNGIKLPVIPPKPEPEVEMVLINGKHFYQVFDEATPYYVSVTTILSALAKGKGFEVWLTKKTQEEQEDILGESSLRGSKVHRAIQLLIEGKQITPEEFIYEDQDGRTHKGLTTEEKNMVYAFVRWWYAFNPKVYASEKIVYNTTYKFAGTLDFIGTIKEGLIDKNSPTPNRDIFTIVDWKTSSGIYPSYEMQLAAYAAAEHQMSGRKIERGAILRLGTKHKTGYEFKIIDSLAESYRAFLGVLAAWKYQNPDFAPRFVELPKLFSLPPIEQVEVKKEADENNIKTPPETVQADSESPPPLPDEMWGGLEAPPPSGP